MFTVSKRIEIAGGHRLNLPYESDCNNQHGHNWIITVEVNADKLSPFGMVIDFKSITKIIKEYDHSNLTPKTCNFNPTAENLAKQFCKEIQEVIDNDENFKYNGAVVSKVTVQESEGNIACYTP